LRNRSSDASAAKLSSPTNCGARSRSHEVRLIARVAKIGPADRTASPIRVGARKRSAQRPSPLTGPPPRPAVAACPAPRRSPRAVTAGSASGPASGSGPGPHHAARARSLAREQSVQLGNDGIERLLGGLQRLVEDIRVELGLEGRREVVVAL